MKTCLLLISLVASLAEETKKHCLQGRKRCGDSFCCCDKNVSADCINQNLTYIPKLPANIKSLTFQGNDIKTLLPETFANISHLKLKSLVLAANGIENIHNDSFARLPDLQSLNLQNNNNLNYSQFSASLYSVHRKLSKLHLGNTGIRHLHDDIFDGLRKTNIQYIYLNNNKIKLFNERAFYHLGTLRHLDLSYNWINNITVTSNGSRLGHTGIDALSLAHNEFVYWPPWFCSSRSSNTALYPRLKKLDLSGNVIIVPVREAWGCLKHLHSLDLRGNVIQVLGNDTFVDLISLEKLYVSYMAKPISQIEPKAFHNQHLKHLEFDNNGMSFRPDSPIPYTSLFTFCQNLTKLLLGYNDFRNVVDNKLATMLAPLSKLTELHLDGAGLYKLPENLFGRFIDLRKLYLGYNKLQSIEPKAFSNVSKLYLLSFEANKIKVINDSFPEELRKSLNQINLSNNPFSCTFCTPNNNIWFRNWIDSSNIKFTGWPDYYKCASPPNKLGEHLQTQHPTEKDCEQKDPMIIAYVTIGVFLLIFISFGIAGYKTRWYIRYYTIKLRKKCVCSGNDDPDRQRLLGNQFTYDAYVIYHDNDRSFVRSEILKFMEDENQYKLFIWDRDFTAGDHAVSVVVDNICKSNHVIAVISRSFLKDQWCDFQLAVSIDRQFELKRNYLTLLILEDVDKKLLSKSWCVLFTKTQTAEWCERKNDIRRKLFEHQILSCVPRMNASSSPSRHAVSVNNA